MRPGCSGTRHRIAALTVAVLSAFGVGRATSQPAAPGGQLPDVQTLGPRIGDRIPDFTLTDQHGQPRTLRSVMGANGLMLVFYRSADW